METGRRDGTELPGGHVSAPSQQSNGQRKTESVTRRLPERSIRGFGRQAQVGGLLEVIRQTQGMNCSPDSQRKKSDWCLILGIPPQLLQPLGAAAIPFIIFISNGILCIKILMILFRGIKYRSGSNFCHHGLGKSF